MANADVIDLKRAMSLYNVPGISEVQSLDDYRGDGLGEEGHLLDRAELGGETGSSIARDLLSKYNCFCSAHWLCNRPANAALTGDDGLDGCTGDDLTDYIGAVAIGIDVLSADVLLGADDDWSGDDEFYAMAADALVLGADPGELIELGWDPLKAVKKAVKKVSAVHSKITSPLAKAAGKLTAKLPKPLQGLGNAVVKSAISLTNPANMFNPKKLIKDQIAVTKASLPIAKKLVKSPLVKTVVGGAAVIFPPIGVPAAAALATASAIANAVDSKIPGVKAAAEKVVANTASVIAAGKKAPPNSQAAKDAKGAEIALAQITQAKKAQTLTRISTPSVPGAKRLIHEISPNGRIKRIVA